MSGCKVTQTKKAVREAVLANEVEEVKEKTLPITVLSGFLGAGKTTLLRHMLTHAGDRRIACIVNDVAALNIDSALVRANVKQQTEELVELQNGCVCCTLRADLVKAVASMARQGAFDFIVIECTGMAEPMQVAASFLMALAVDDDEKNEAEEDDPAEAEKKAALEAELPSLNGLARLDTMVTVIDSSSFMDVIERTGNVFAFDDGTGNVNMKAISDGDDVTMAEEEDGAKAEEEGVEEDMGMSEAPKLIVDLMLEQVEFADVIVLNKTDLVTKATLAKVRQGVAALNPGAKILETHQSSVPLVEVLGTGRFDPVETAEGVGWLKALRETKEFGVNSFVYRRRRPFHPKRFFELLQTGFYVDTDWLSRMGDHGHDHGSDDVHDHDEHGGHSHGHAGHSHGKKDVVMAEKSEDKGDEEEEGEEEDEYEAVDLEEMEKEIKDGAARKKASVFASVLRSKGFLWIATRPDMKGSWGHAGAVVRLDPEFPWACIHWPFAEQFVEGEDPEITKLRTEIKVEKYADRKQELVFIGVIPEEQQKAIIAALDACLVTDEEWKDLAKLVVDDPIPMWQETPFQGWDKYVEEEE